MATRLVQIVPRLAPSLDGVGDYGLTLARELKKRYGVEGVFICGSPAWRGPTETDGFYTCGAGPDVATNLPRLLREFAPDGSTVLLNYVGPGYDRNSCPFALLRGLKTWRAGGGRARLITMFHELYSEGPPWTRAFWTNPAQRYIAAAIAGLSDLVRTNVDVMRRRLARMIPRRQVEIECVPVFSNVGESEDSPSTDERSPWLAVFGSAGWRTAAYRQYRRSLESACSDLRVEQILDIGPPLGFLPELPVPVRTCGRLEAAEVAGLLRQCRFGFSSYPTAWLGKSGIFAAYCAHGCIPVAPAECRQAEIGRGGGAPVHFCDTPASATEWPLLQRRVRDWYWPHSLQNQAKHYAALISSTA